MTEPKISAKAPKVWINAGEISGDMHGAALLAELQKRIPNLNCIGMGGPALEKQGMCTLFRVEDLSVMGFIEVLGMLPKIYKLLKAIKAKLQSEKPDLLICIDAASFNFRVIKAARALNIPVVFHISPKIWAWGANRGFFLKEQVKRLISILPFEVDFYKRFNMNIDYVGNPLVDLVNFESLKDIASVKGRIGILPGSRKKEINVLMPRFAGAAKIINQSVKNLEFHCIAAPAVDRNLLKTLWEQHGGAGIKLEIHSPENRYALMRSCQLIIAASGTATLECALVRVPTIVTYAVSHLTYFIGEFFVKIKYAALPNLIINDDILPELLQNDCLPKPLAHAALMWLDPENQELKNTPDAQIWQRTKGPKDLATVRKGIDKVNELIGNPGAAKRAAEVVYQELELLGKV